MAVYPRVKAFLNKNGTSREYLYLVDSVWDKDKKGCRQKNLVNLGRLDQLQADGAIDCLVEKLERFCKTQKLINLDKDLSCQSAFQYGEIIVFRKLWKTLGFEKIFAEQTKNRRWKTNLGEVIFAMVCYRLLSPGSDLHMESWLEQVYQQEWSGFATHSPLAIN